MKIHPTSSLPQFVLEEKKPNHPPLPTRRLSEDAFYLLALASLLRKAVEPGQLRQFLVPGAVTRFANKPVAG